MQLVERVSSSLAPPLCEHMAVLGPLRSWPKFLGEKGGWLLLSGRDRRVNVSLAVSDRTPRLKVSEVLPTTDMCAGVVSG